MNGEPGRAVAAGSGPSGADGAPTADRGFAHAPVPAPAPADPRTAGALRAYRRRAGRLVLGGALVAVAVAAAMAAGVAEPVGQLMAPVITFSLMACAIGLGSLAVARRMAAALGAGPWRACAARAVPQGLQAAGVVLADPVTGELLPLRVVALQQRYPVADPGPAGVLWWCGDARRGGVLAPPGGGSLIWARPVRGRRERLRYARVAEARGMPVPAP
ncbi:hypothetical protein [Streptomyces sp. NPDC005805]|uniref:hypothetical protein n=1 Tax=Streptomyces sp. NPDC005805 TaxID=3157068 RepID=UPI0033D210F1